MGNTYLWVKIIHIAFVVAWMAVLLYLPRIFVYHADVKNTSETSNIFKVMERRLYYYIGHPAALLVWASGLYMAHALGLYGLTSQIALLSNILLNGFNMSYVPFCYKVFH